MSTDGLDQYVSSYDFAVGFWNEPLLLGTTSTRSFDPIAYGTTRVDISTDIADGLVHYFILQPQPPPDNTLPAVALTSPQMDSFLSGTVDVVASASDDVGVAGVEFYLGNALLATDTSNSYQVPFDTATVADGSDMLQAKAYDAAGNTGLSDPLVITVDNTAPTVSITSPGNGATVSGNISVSSTASDNTAVARWTFTGIAVSCWAPKLQNPIPLFGILREFRRATVPCPPGRWIWRETPLPPAFR